MSQASWGCHVHTPVPSVCPLSPLSFNHWRPAVTWDCRRSTYQMPTKRQPGKSVTCKSSNVCRTCRASRWINNKNGTRHVNRPKRRKQPEESSVQPCNTTHWTSSGNLTKLYSENTSKWKKNDLNQLSHLIKFTHESRCRATGPRWESEAVSSHIKYHSFSLLLSS